MMFYDHFDTSMFDAEMDIKPSTFDHDIYRGFLEVSTMIGVSFLVEQW